MQEPRKYWHGNVLTTLRLLDAMHEHGTPRLVFSSTAATYGEPDEVPITEDAPTRPTNTYGATKLAIDHAITSYAAAHGLAATSLRYFNVAGAHGAFGERHTVETHLIPIVLQVALGQREQVQIFGDDWPTEDGTCVRDYIHVTDLADAHHREHAAGARIGERADAPFREVLDGLVRLHAVDRERHGRHAAHRVADHHHVPQAAQPVGQVGQQAGLVGLHRSQRGQQALPARSDRRVVQPRQV